MRHNKRIAGDYNCGGIDWHNLDLRKEIPAQPCDRDLLDLTDKYGLTQHVKSPTRPSSGRTLDLVFSSNPNTVQAHHVTPGISDHDAILFEVDLSPKYTPKPPRKVYQFHKADYDGLRFHLPSFSNQYLTSDPGKRSVEENWHKISETIHEAMDKYIPHRMSKAKRHLPWVSASVKRMMNRRDRAHKKARRTGKPKDQVAYKRLHNATVNRVKPMTGIWLRSWGVSTPLRHPTLLLSTASSGRGHISNFYALNPLGHPHCSGKVVFALLTTQKRRLFANNTKVYLQMKT